MRTWRTCRTHGDEKPNAYGCAECVREQRQRIVELEQQLTEAKRLLLQWVEDTTLVDGGVYQDLTDEMNAFLTDSQKERQV